MVKKIFPLIFWRDLKALGHRKKNFYLNNLGLVFLTIGLAFLSILSQSVVWQIVEKLAFQVGIITALLALYIYLRLWQKKTKETFLTFTILRFSLLAIIFGKTLLPILVSTVMGLLNYFIYKLIIYQATGVFSLASSPIIYLIAVLVSFSFVSSLIYGFVLWSWKEVYANIIGVLAVGLFTFSICMFFYTSGLPKGLNASTSILLFSLLNLILFLSKRRLNRSTTAQTF